MKRVYRKMFLPTENRYRLEDDMDGEYLVYDELEVIEVYPVEEHLGLFTFDYMRCDILFDSPPENVKWN